ncbi:MAG TPA: hypothetical protein VFO25_09705 [Candidatus Eremiobacteraceae bacterium]|nr:hypothetical protein [Candidatus Eremiobacteraceae bacterium]
MSLEPTGALAPDIRIPLQPGDQIGVNTFPDGDTSSGGQGQKIDNLLECHGFINQTFHIHTHLSIFDPTGTQIMVPWGIGLVPPWTFDRDNDEIATAMCGYNLHTHDRSGVIHDEAKTNLNLTLGQFFDVWGMPLSSSNVAGYTGTVWVKVVVPGNNMPWSNSIDPRTILLSDDEQITLAVANKVKNPPIYDMSKF